jgi:ribosomal RNA-processing protein 8
MLYTTTSSEAVEKTKENPGLLLAYHEGFRHQVSQWPVNPVDVFIGELQSMLTKRARSNGHVGDEKLVVADLGCGEAKIAQSFKEDTRIKVHSYDLTAVNPYVTACDIARTPLASKSADVAIFCLSLMGTNYLDFVKEAVRMLKTRLVLTAVGSGTCLDHRLPQLNSSSGQLRIAEVKSRISDTDGFVEAIESCGLRLQYKVGSA